MSLAPELEDAPDFGALAVRKEPAPEPKPPVHDLARARAMELAVEGAGGFVVPAEDEEAKVEEVQAEPEPPIEYVRPGGLQVTLDHPFRYGDRLVDRIVIPPMPFGLQLDVKAGLYPTLFDVLVAQTGEREAVLRALRGGDEDVVMATFVKLLPESIRSMLTV